MNQVPRPAHALAKLAWLGLALSAGLHLSTFFGWVPGPVFPVVFALHAGAIGLAFVAFLSVRHLRPFDMLRFDWAPRWAFAALLAAFVYAGINFMRFISAVEALPREESPAKQVLELRGFSGHWIFFYLLSAILLQFPPASTVPTPIPPPPTIIHDPAAHPPRIRMWLRSLLLLLLFFGGSFGFVFDFAFSARGGVPGPAWLFGWVGLNGGLQHWLLRCPSCRKQATRSPSGWSSPFVGTKCRWCGRPY